MAGYISDATTVLSNLSLSGNLAANSFVQFSSASLSRATIQFVGLQNSNSTLNLNAGHLMSVRTLAGSAVTASAGGGSVAADEAVFTVTLGSGASLLLRSGGTIWIFNSAASSIVA